MRFRISKSSLNNFGFLFDFLRNFMKPSLQAASISLELIAFIGCPELLLLRALRMKLQFNRRTKLCEYRMNIVDFLFAPVLKSSIQRINALKQSCIQGSKSCILVF